MTVEVNSNSANLAPYPDDQIKIRPYIEALVKHWKFIIWLVLIAAITAFVWLSLRPAQYTTEADVSLLNIHSEVVFDEQFKTVPLEEVGSRGVGGSARKDALLNLARSRSLLTEVFDQVSPHLEPEDQNFGAFRKALDVEVSGDLLRLRVTWDDPEIAAAIANAWAQHFTSVANRAFVSTSSETPEEAIAVAGTAFEKYQIAQRELEAHIAESDIVLLRGELAEMDTLIEELRTQKTDVLRLASQDRVRELNDWYERKVTLERLHNRLEDLRAQLEAGSASAPAAGGDALALVFTRSGLLNQGDIPDLQLALDLSQLGEADRDLASTDVETLLEINTKGLEEANREIERLTDELYLGTNPDIPNEIPEDHKMSELVSARLEATVDLETMLEAETTDLEAGLLSHNLVRLSGQRQDLRAQLEMLEAQDRELSLARDTAWDLYQTLENKAREVEAQFATGAPQVRVAFQAVPPLKPDPIGRLRLSLIAAAVGGMIGVAYAAGRVYWESSAPAEESGPPLQETQPAPEYGQL